MIEYIVHSSRLNTRFYGRHILENRVFYNKKDAYDYLMKRMKKLVLPIDRESVNMINRTCKRKHMRYNFYVRANIPYELYEGETKYSSYSFQEYSKLVEEYNNNPNSTIEDYKRLLLCNVDARYYNIEGMYIKSNEQFNLWSDNDSIWIKESMDY